MKNKLLKTAGLFSGIILTTCVGISMLSFSAPFSVSPNNKVIEASATEGTSNGTPAVGTKYKIVSSPDQLVAGGNYTFIYDEKPTRSEYCYQITNSAVSSGKIAAEKIKYVSYYDSDSRTIASTSSTLNFELGVGSTSGSWTLKTTNYSGTNGYLNASGMIFSALLTVQTAAANISLSEEGQEDHIYYIMFSNNALLNCSSGLASTSYKFGASNSSYSISIFKAEEAKTAKDWAEDFLDKTKTKCTDPNADNHEALGEIWEETETFYNQLDDTNKELLLNATGTEADYGEAIRLYDHIMKRYNAKYSSLINNYINRDIPQSEVPAIYAAYNNFVPIITSIVSFACVSIVACCIIAKHKTKKTKRD